MRNKKLRIGISIGDVNGIGPELVIHAFDDPYLREICIPILYGSSRVLNIYRKVLQYHKFHYVVIQNPDQAQYKKLNVIECVPDLERVEIGRPSEMGGKAAYLSLKRAIEDAQHGVIDALVTMPVDKSTFQNHAPEFTGHTEMLAQAFGVEDNLMMMASEDLKVALVTNHLPLKDVARNITTQRIYQKIRMLHRSLHNDFNIAKAKIAVLGLNPHAGDNDLIGQEDNEVILPAIEQAKKKGILVEGPYSADGFFGALTYRKFDAVLAMYHDQGLIPFKLLSGFRGVNFTAGMPFIRTSPNHGVAYDLVGAGTADVESFRQSLYMAMDAWYNRKENEDLQEVALDSAKSNLLKEDKKAEASVSSSPPPPPPPLPTAEPLEEAMEDTSED